MLVCAAFLPRGTQASGLLRAVRRAAPLTAGEILSHMDDAARQVKTISARLTYTTVTVVVNDRSTQYGELFFRKGRHPEFLMRFSKPSLKELLFKRNRAEIYYPQLNQIQIYDLASHRELLQQFLLLGFGSRTSEIEEAYHVRYLGEKPLDGVMTPVLDLTPTSKDVAAKLSKVDLWISRESWLPIRQEVFEPSGDYLIATYSKVQINPPLASSTFKIKAKPGVERLKMN